MTETFYNTGKFEVDHTTFGGEIFLSDFETEYKGKDNKNGSFIAARIEADIKFDDQCRKNIENRERNKRYDK